MDMGGDLVNETVELHQPAVLPQVIFGLAHHGVAAPVRPLQADLLGLLQGGQDLHLGKYAPVTK